MPDFPLSSPLCHRSGSRIRGSCLTSGMCMSMPQHFRRRHRPVKGVVFSRWTWGLRSRKSVGSSIMPSFMLWSPAAESSLFRTCQGLLTDNLSGSSISLIRWSYWYYHLPKLDPARDRKSRLRFCGVSRWYEDYSDTR
jgi:hypothetical protein